MLVEFSTVGGLGRAVRADTVVEVYEMADGGTTIVFVSGDAHSSLRVTQSFRVVLERLSACVALGSR